MAKHLAELAEEAFVAIDEDGRICEWNRAAEKIFSAKRSSVLEKDVGEVLFSLTPRSILEMAAEGKNVTSSEVRWKNKKLLFSAAPYQVNKKKEEIHLFFQDQTIQKRDEQKLQAIEQSPDIALLVLDEELNLKEWSGDLNNFFGQTGVGEKFESLFKVKPEMDGQQEKILSRSNVPLLLDFLPGQETTVIIRNISERTEAEEKAKKLENLLERSEEIVISRSTDNKITEWNGAAEETYGWSRDEIIGKDISLLQPPDYQEKESEASQRVLAGEQEVRLEVERWSKEGKLIPVLISIAPLRDIRGTIIGISTIEHDKRLEERFQNRLRFLSEHDALTDLKNRKGFISEVLEKNTSDEPRVLLLLDIDHFKFVNESYGYEAGDELIKLIGREIENEGEAARVGSNQFALLLENSDPEAGEEFVAKKTEAIYEKSLDELHLPVTISTGLVLLFPGEEQEGEEILGNAELALFQAKEKARGSIVLDTGRKKNMHWPKRIQRAIDQEGLVLYAQPIAKLPSGEISSYELLLRLKDPDLGIVSPGEFLTTAERLGLISTIDYWVASEGIALASRGHSVEINISGRSMTDPGLFRVLEREIENYKIDPKQLVFEITETTAIASIEEATRFSNRIQDLGCRFALDDFGVGFGSFTYLKHLPLEIIKIDGEFIRELTSSTEDRAIVSSIVSLARGLGLETIAEWVGDEDTFDLTAELGVDMAQGYFVGKPKPASDL